jgi:hypothetical protein
VSIVDELSSEDFLIPYPNHVLMPLSLGPVRQTFPTIRLYRNLSLYHLNLGGHSGLENAEDGALCDGLFTVME